MKIGCLSDLHLKPGDPPSKDNRLYGALVNLASQCDHIVIGGDLLEMYTRAGGRGRHFRKIASAYAGSFDFISRHTDSITVIEGNHDDGCLSLIPGVVPVEHVVFDDYYFFHGHQADLYFAHRTMEKAVEKIIKVIFRLEAWTFGLTGFRVSELFARWQHRNQAGADTLGDYCLGMLNAARPFLRGVVAGHTHIKDYRLLGCGRVYVNSGTYQNGDIMILDTVTGEIRWL